MNGLRICALFGLLLACGGGETKPAETAPEKKLPEGKVKKPSATELCRARCERAAACQAADGNCMKECLGWQRTTEHIRGDLLWRLLTCLDSIECPFVQQGNAWEQCFEVMKNQIPLTDSLRQFCFESARRAAVCGRRNEANQMGCRDQFRHLEDAVLEKGRECLKLSCAQVPVCFRRYFHM